VVFVFRATTLATVAAMDQTPAFSHFSRHFEALTPPQTIDSLEVHAPPVLTKLRRDEAIAVTWVHTHKLVHRIHNLALFFGIDLCLIALRAPRLTKRLTCPTLRHVFLALCVFDGLSTLRRAQ
jgi:hypothetical protein